MSRNAIDVYDPEIVHRQAQLEVRRKMQERGEQPQRIDANAPIFRMFEEMAEKEVKRFREREEELRRRDPSFRPDALDFTSELARAFDKDVDYYKVLGLDELASSLEIKKAYMRRSLQLHPDKQVGKAEADVAIAVELFKELTEAYEILGDQPTRRQYDRARDKQAVLREQYGDSAGASSTPNPPTCVDVELTLEQLYYGVVKQVDFEQLTWEHWSKRDVGNARRHRLKVNRGTLEGTTFWFKAEGHQRQGHARSDLVFVVQQRKHPTFERVGDDLWHYLDETTAAEALLFARVVPTLTGRARLATGHTLPMLLGFDRSGLGESIVDGCGMPLRDDPYHPMPAAAAPLRTNGDLIVRFRVAPPRRASSRVEVCGGGIATPPVVLITSADGRGAPMAPTALEALRTHTLLPALLQFAHRATQRAHMAASAARVAAARPASAAVAAGADEAFAAAAVVAAASAAASLATVAACTHAAEALRGVCLCVGSDANGCSQLPSACARQLMTALSGTLPQFTWRVIHAASPADAVLPGVAPLEPLLDDEASALATAAVILLEAAPDVRPAPAPPAPSSCSSSSTTSSLASSNTANTEPLSHHAFEVVWPAGVRVRSSPSTGAPVVRILRGGMRARAAAASDGWLHLEAGGFVLIESASMGALVRLVDDGTPAPASMPSATPPALAGSGVTLVAATTAIAPGKASGDHPEPAQASAHEAAVEAAEARAAKAEAAALAAQHAEDAAVETDRSQHSAGQLKAMETESLSGGCRAALSIMSAPSAAAIYQSHCSGGVLVGIDRGCVLLGNRPTDKGSHGKKPPTRASGADNGRAIDEAASPLPTWPALLPFAVSLGDGLATDKSTWRPLRRAIHRFGLRDNAHGYSAVGLPPGSVVFALSAQRFALRSVLGSAAPLKVSRVEVDQDERRREKARTALRVDRRRRERLAAMASQEMHFDLLTATRPHQSDINGELRGSCESCHECPGWCQPYFAGRGGHTELVLYCAQCGCSCTEHESLGMRSSQV